MTNDSFDVPPPSDHDAPPPPPDEEAEYRYASSNTNPNTKSRRNSRRAESQRAPNVSEQTVEPNDTKSPTLQPEPTANVPNPTNPFADTLTGVLERVTYHNEDNGYTVGRLAVEGARDLITIVGNFSNPVVGEQLFCEGKWIAHREYGRQFTIERYSTTKPATAFAIEKYLGSGLIKGIGPVMAKRMVDLFGLETLDVIETDPKKLLRVEGIGEKRIEKIQKAWHEQREIRNVMLFLQGHGVSATFAVKIYKTYGDRSIQTVEENPYKLAQDIWGIGFKTADKIALQMGIALESDKRLEAGLLYTLSEATDFGHLFLPEPKLLTAAAAILSVDTRLIAPVMDSMVAAETVISEEIEGVEMAGRAMRAMYHPALYYTEIGLAAQIRRRLGDLPGMKPVNREKIAAWLQQQEQKSGFKLSEEQTEAVMLALERRFLVLTGGPGTGKTATTNLIARAFDAQKKRIQLVSPTGRAAKRLNEVTGRDAQTIHRLLKFDPATHSFQYNENNPLPCDVLIADEVSMLDAVLANNLLKAMPETAQIVFVGDSDQLPSVGAGNVLGDLLRSEVVPSIRLTQVFRQAQESLIVTNAHRIRKGEFPVLVPPKEREGNNMLFMQMEDGEEAEAGADIVVRLARKTLPMLGYRGDDIQVLSALKKGSLGVDFLNLRLQEALNPADPSGRRPEMIRGSRRFRIGDRVIQLVNNYDKNVFNGDIGVITDIRPEDQLILVRFLDETVEYDYADYDELQLAYTLSIHKCISKQERVWTRDRGMVAIQDLNVGEHVYTGRGATKQILKKVSTGHKRIVRVTTQMGYSIDVSAEHPLLAMIDGKTTFVTATDLTPKHFLCIDRSAIQTREEVLLPPIEFRQQHENSCRTAKENSNVTIPKVLDEELAWLLGIMVGDGSSRDVRDGTIDITNQDIEILTRVREIFERYNLPVGIYQGTGNAPRYHVISHSFRTWLQKIGLDYCSACEKRIPEIIFRASIQIRSAFIRGLFDTEGSAGQNTCRACRLTTCSPGLSQDVQKLLLSLGIVSQRFRYGENAWHVSISETSLSGFFDSFGIPTATDLEEVMQPQYLYDRVETVETCDETEEMYDLEIEGIHSFVANGFVCHNSQGSEYRAVVLVMHSSQYMMLQRNLLYTGLTRARDLCIVVGDKKAIARAVKNDKTTRRYTRLAERLQAEN